MREISTPGQENSATALNHHPIAFPKLDDAQIAALVRDTQAEVTSSAPIILALHVGVSLAAEKQVKVVSGINIYYGILPWEMVAG